MKPKEKAEELINKFSDLEDGEMYIGKAKQCALIAVDYLMREAESSMAMDYWFSVKQEIEKL
jgi:hypothetical protein